LIHLIEPLVDAGTQIIILEVALHLNPEDLRERLIKEIKRIEDESCDIILGYGLCGRALEGVYSEKSRLILPKVDDCVGMILGSRDRHKKLMTDHPGCFFFEPDWIDTEMDIFVQSRKGLDRIPEDKRDGIVKMILCHYTSLALLDHGFSNGPEAESRCRQLAEENDFKYIKFNSDLGLLERLVKGEWSKDEFIITEPGEKIGFF
jgi:hypothetical protein